MVHRVSIGVVGSILLSALACGKSRVNVGDLENQAGQAGSMAGASGSDEQTSGGGDTGTAGSLGEGGRNHGGSAGKSTRGGGSSGGSAGTQGEQGGAPSGGTKPTGGAGQSGGEAGASGAVSIPVEPVPSRQSVRFRVQNRSDAVLYVPTEGTNCDLFQIAALDAGQESSLPLSLSWVPNSCGCPMINCDYPTATVSTYATAQAGDQIVYEWDARSLELYTESFTCSDSLPTTFDVVGGALRPVASGRYRVTVGYDELVPENCTKAEDGAYQCSSGWGGLSGQAYFCHTPLTASVEFELPEEGDIEVAIPLPSGQGLGGSGGMGGAGGSAGNDSTLGGAPSGGASGGTGGIPGAGGATSVTSCTTSSDEIDNVRLDCDQGGEVRWFLLPESILEPEGCREVCVAPGALIGYASLVDCRKDCGGYAPSYCTQPPDGGPCDGSIPSWAFNAATGACEQFVYGGCEGNENRFATEELCTGTCQGEQQCYGPSSPGYGECVEGTGCTFCSMTTSCAGGCSCQGGSFLCGF
jgi:hypothetical protein